MQINNYLSIVYLKMVTCVIFWTLNFVSNHCEPILGKKLDYFKPITPHRYGCFMTNERKQKISELLIAMESNSNTVIQHGFCCCWVVVVYAVCKKSYVIIACGFDRVGICVVTILMFIIWCQNKDVTEKQVFLDVRNNTSLGNICL